MPPDLSIILMSLIVVLVAFLIFREVVCWYWKINYGIELLEKIHSELEKMNAGNKPKN